MEDLAEDFDLGINVRVFAGETERLHESQVRLCYQFRLKIKLIVWKEKKDEIKEEFPTF